MKGRASAKTKRCGFKKGEGEEEEREKKQKKEKRKKKERKRERRKKNRLSCTRRLLGSFHSPHVEAGHRATNAQKRERKRERGGRFRSRRPSRFTEIQNNGSVPFRQSPVTRSSRDRIAGGGNFLASTPWRRREVGEVCWWWDDDNVERGKETYPRDDTSGRVRGQASTLELVLRTGGTSLLCGQKEGA